MSVSDPSIISSIILSILLSATFISIFFFTYVSKVEGEIVKNQMNSIVQDITGGINAFLPDAEEEKLKESINGINLPDMSQQDNETQTANNALMKQAIMAIAVVNGVGLLIILGLWYYYRFPVKTLIIQNIIIIAFVAITEFCFVTFITKNYKPLDPNYVKYLFVTQLEKFSNN